MDSATVFSTALTAVIIGGGMLLLVYVSARWLGQRGSSMTSPTPVALDTIENLTAANDGVVVARQGGRILFANEQARKLFGLNGGRPDLNRMAQLVEPQAAFYELFAAAGQTQLTVSERPIEATSIQLPASDPPQFVVVLREAERLSELAGGGESSAIALSAMAELSQVISASLDLSQTLESILKTVGRVLNYQLAEIYLWNAAKQQLQAGAQAGDQAYLTALNQLGTAYKPDASFAGWIARHRRRLLISDVDRQSDTQSVSQLAHTDFPLRAVLGAPLTHAQQLVGTLHISARLPEAYGEREAALLETIAAPAAIAIHNAQRFAEQEERVAELSGLIQVAQTSALISDPQELHASLTDRIAKLMDVAFCGILLYNEVERALIAQPPFRGVPDIFIEAYRIPMPPDSIAERMWLEDEYWYTNDTAVDPLVAEIGLKPLAEAFGVTTSILVPLIVGGRRIGVIQASNKNDGEPFTDVDARKLVAFAGQAAALIDNARLVREAETRARRAEGVHRIADLSSSRLPLDEIIKQVVAEAVQLFAADFGIVFLLDETRGELAPHPDSAYDGATGNAIPSATLEEAGVARLDSSHPNYKYTVTASMRPFYTGRASADDNIIDLYRPAQEYFQTESAMLIPLVAGGRGIGEIWIGARREHSLGESDMPVLSTVAAHLASAIERSRLGEATDDTLRRRVEQLSALARVSRELNRTLELEHILQAVYDEAIRASGAEGGSIALLDLDAAEPRLLRRLGETHTTTDLTDIEREVALAGEGRIISDFSTLELKPPHAEVHSALVAPIAYQDQTVGLIHLHSTQPDGFDDAMLEFTQALAGHAAIAVGNAQRYEEQMRRGELLRRRADQLAQLLRISRAVRSDHPLEETLEAIAFGIQEAVGFNVVSIRVLDTETNQLHLTAAAGVPLAMLAQMKAEPQPWGPITEALRDEFQISQSYFIPHDRRPESLGETNVYRPVRTESLPENGGWHAGDLLIVPLVGSGGQTLGTIYLDEPRSGKIPKRATAETLEIFANQAALAIENARLFESAEQRAAELAQSLATVQQSYRELDEVSRSLQHKEQEMSQLVEHLDVRNARLLALHRLSAAVIGITEPEVLLQTVAEKLHQEMGLDLGLIVRAPAGGDPTDNALELAGVSGAIPAEVNLEALLAAENVLRHVITEREPLLVRDPADRRWSDDPLVKALQIHSFVATPIIIEGAVSGALLAGSQSAPSPFSPEDIDLFTILAQQVGISLENAALHITTQQRLREQTALQEAGAVFSATLELEAVLNQIAVQLGKALDATSAYLCSYEPETQASTILAEYLSPYASSEESQPDLGVTYYLPTDFPGTVEFMLSGEPDISHYDDPDLDEVERQHMLKYGAKSTLAIPLQVGGEVIAYAELWESRQRREFTVEEIALAQGIAQQAAIALQNARLLAETQELQVFTDEVFQSIQQGIVVLNAQSEILSLNEFIRRRYGWDDEAIGQNIFEYRYILRDLGLAAQLQQVLQTGEPLTGLSIRYPLNRDELILTNVSGYTLRRAGEVSGVVLLFEDVSEQARLQADVRERAAQLQALTEVSRVISSALRVEDVISLVLEQVGSVIPFNSATLWLREGSFLRVAATTGFADDENRLGLMVDVADSQLYNEMAESQQPIVVGDVREDARFPGGTIQPTRSWLGIPLISKGQVLGSLALDKVEIDFYNAGHVELARGFANQAAVALDNARLFEESVQRAIQLNERTQRLQLLNHLSAELGTSLDIGHVLNVAAEQMAHAVSVEQASIVLFDKEAGIGRLAAEYPQKPHPPFEVTIPLGQNPSIAHVRETMAPLAIEDVASDPMAESMRQVLLDRQVKSILIVPLIVGGNIIGTIDLDELEGRRRFRPGEIELAQTIANQAAIAIQNARLYEETQQRLVELETINYISRAITATMDLEQLMGILREQITGLLETENVYVALYDPETDEVSFPLYYREGAPAKLDRRPVGGLTERIIRSRQPLLLSGKLELGEEDPGPDNARVRRLARSYFGLPLLAGDKVIGVITVLDFERYNAFTHAHERILTTLAAQVAVAIENARLFGEVQASTEALEQRIAERTRDLEHERDRVETLLRITSELSASLDLDSVLTRALTLVNDAVNASQGSLFLIDPQSEQLVYRAALGRAKPLPPGGVPSPFERGEGLVGWVIANRQTVVASDLDEDERWLKRPYSDRHKSALAAPVISGEDVLGALIFYSGQRNAFDQEQLRLVTAAANQVASAVNNSELYRLIRDQAERLGSMLRTQQVEASKVRAILEAVADGVMVSDQNSTIILFNGSAEHILQLSRSEVLGRTASEFIGIYGAAGQSWLNAIERWSAEPDAFQPGDFLAERLELEDKRIISIHLAPVIGDGEFIGSVSLFRDITRDVEIDRLKTEFVTTVSHELRTPMTSIKGYADLLLLGAAGPLEAQQRDFMETIKSNADRLKMLVEDLLDISKIESGKIELNLTQLDINDFMQEVLEHLHGSISDGDKEMTVVNELPPTLPSVFGDEVRLIQIFRNLVDNAYTYSPPGGTITIRAVAESGTVQIDVQDTGIGIKQEDQARIFERFYRGEDQLVLASAGTGLGLNIVQRLVEMHGGHIWVESEGPGKGSTFSVLLPTTEANPAANVKQVER